MASFMASPLVRRRHDEGKNGRETQGDFGVSKCLLFDSLICKNTSRPARFDRELRNIHAAHAPTWSHGRIPEGEYNGFSAQSTRVHNPLCPRVRRHRFGPTRLSADIPGQSTSAH